MTSTISATEFSLDRDTQYVMTIGDEPEGCIFQGGLYAWPVGAWEPDLSKQVGHFINDLLIIDDRRAGRVSGNKLVMFDGREYLISERDLHQD